MIYRHEQQQSGYYIHRFGNGLVMREEMDTYSFLYQVARWLGGDSYEVLYCTGSKGDASRVYDLTLALDILSNRTKENK